MSSFCTGRVPPRHFTVSKSPSPATSSDMRHREKVLAHAEQELFSQNDTPSEDLLKLYPKFLKLENHRIRLRHGSGGGGREICSQRATVVDIVLRHLLEAVSRFSDMPRAPKLQLSLVAIGGYGRGELNPFSDVDLMFLHQNAGSPEAQRALAFVVEKILYTLWDVGFKVGHSTRSIEEAITQANGDMLSKTSMLEARLVAGSEELFARFQKRFVKECVEGFESEYIAQRVKDQSERHAKHGSTVYMQEPHIKNGCGGLRDYQNLMWISFFKERIRSTVELVDRKLLNETERRQLERAYDFLLRIRNELHYLNNRGVDVIVINQQLPIANSLKYSQKSILRRTEALMRDYYQQARVIYNMTELLSERLCVITPPVPKRTRLLKLLRLSRPPRKEYFDGFYSEDGRVFPENRLIFNQDSARLMRLFHYAQKREERLSPELQQLVRRRLHLVDRTFQYAKANRESFLDILSHKGQVSAVLRAMHQVDFLGRYLPEFGELTCLVQHEFFHRYTADEHTLVCIEKLDALVDTADPKLQDYRKLFLKLEDADVLYLAILLHDTGKAANVSNHSEASAISAQRVAARLQLSAAKRKLLIFLVDHHATLSNTAQRRNLEDNATIAEFASLVTNQQSLDALMLLTLVDGQGVGGETVWSDWKESLVWQLYRSASLYLADDAEYYRRRRIEREDLQKEVQRALGSEYDGETDAHFSAMPERYFLTYPVEAIGDHIRLFRKFFEQRLVRPDLALAPALQWIPNPNRGHTEFWFCGWDRHGLLARIAGALSVAGVNILSADAFTRNDSLVLDIFRICTRDFEAVTDETAFSTAEKVLLGALEDEQYDFRARITRSIGKRGFVLSESMDFPTRIAIDNSSHPTYTLVDVQTPDRLGLLHGLLKALSDEGFEIALSRINTEKGAALDTFYITDELGQKVRDSERLSLLQRSLWQAAAPASVRRDRPASEA